jgi:hypothetical protein
MIRLEAGVARWFKMVFKVLAGAHVESAGNARL